MCKIIEKGLVALCPDYCAIIKEKYILDVLFYWLIDFYFLFIYLLLYFIVDTL